MGACYSVSGPESISLPQVESNLNTGDLILLQEKEATPLYISRAGSWTTFTHVGFLERDGPGPSGLYVCHADCRTDVGCMVVKLRLQDMLQSGRYNTILVRQLCHRLTPEQQDLVSHYVDLNYGKVRPLAAPRCTILMAGMACSRQIERIYSSEFVATMLHLIGVVRQTAGNPLEFRATHEQGLVLQPPVELQIQQQTLQRRLYTNTLQTDEGSSVWERSLSHTSTRLATSTSCSTPSTPQLGFQTTQILQRDGQREQQIIVV